MGIYLFISKIISQINLDFSKLAKNYLTKLRKDGIYRHVFSSVNITKAYILVFLEVPYFLNE